MHHSTGQKVQALKDLSPTHQLKKEDNKGVAGRPEEDASINTTNMVGSKEDVPQNPHHSWKKHKMLKLTLANHKYYYFMGTMLDWQYLELP